MVAGDRLAAASFCACGTARVHSQGTEPASVVAAVVAASSRRRVAVAAAAVAAAAVAAVVGASQETASAAVGVPLPLDSPCPQLLRICWEGLHGEQPYCPAAVLALPESASAFLGVVGSVGRTRSLSPSGRGQDCSELGVSAAGPGSLA